MRLRRPDTAELMAALALLLALALRLWGIGFSPALMRGRPDEEIFVEQALRSFSADLRPDLLLRGWPEGYKLPRQI